MTISIHSVYGDSLYLAELAPRFVDKSDMIRPADCQPSLQQIGSGPQGGVRTEKLE